MGESVTTMAPRLPRILCWAASVLNEGRRHKPGGIAYWAIAVGSVVASAYVVWVGAFAAANIHRNIAIFITIAFPVAFLTTTANKRRSTLSVLDVALAAASFAIGLYYILQDQRYQEWASGLSEVTLLDEIAGVALIILVIELTRRSTGWGLTTLVGILLAYAVLGRYLPGELKQENFQFDYFIDQMTISVNGIFGSPLEVASSYAFLFVLFGSFYHRAGGGQMFFELAGAITGRMIGGAAKACITCSGLYGSVSGSPVADVATTGPLTIPIMKRTGIGAVRAGALEAAASCGGAILPPVMGAVAFIMSDFTDIPYARIAAASLLPAILYYFAIYVAVHSEALRLGEGSLPESDIVPLATALKRGWIHIIPLVVLVWLLVADYSPVYVASVSTAAVIVLSWFRVESAIGPRRLVESCINTVMQLVPLVGAVAAAGAIIGCISLTGLDGKVSVLMFSLSGGQLVPTLAIAALILILLGMGMPTVAVYTTGVALLAPILLGKFNLPIMPTHLFLLYFSCMSAITPPVAVASFAAGAIAGASPMAIGPQACKIAFAGFLLPFFFLFHQGLLMMGGPGEIVLAVLFGAIMVAFAAFAINGWLGARRIAGLVRFALATSAAALMVPDLRLEAAAAVVGSLILLALWWLVPAVPTPSGTQSQPVDD